MARFSKSPISGDKEGAKMRIPGLSAALNLAVTCALAQALVGYNQNVYSEPVKVQSPRLSPSTSFSAVIWSISIFGAIFSSIVAILIGNYFGRRTLVGVGIVAIGIGAIIESAAFQAPQFIAGEVIAGLGYGLVSLAAPIWQLESTQSTGRRGMMVMVQFAANSAGSMTAQWASYKFRDSVETPEPGSPASVSWRLPVAIQLVLFVPALVFLWFSPESPRWLINHGRNDEALQTLAKLNNSNTWDTSIRQMHDALLQRSQSLWSLFGSSLKQDQREFSRRKWLRFTLSILLQLFFSFGGGVVIINVTLSVVFSNDDSNELNGVNKYLFIVGPTLSFLATAVSILLVDRLGRRKLTWMSFFGMAISSLAALVCVVVLQVTGGWVAYTGADDSTTGSTNSSAHIPAQTALVVFCFIFLAFQGFLFGTAWIYLIELNSPSLRLASSAASMIIQSLSGFIWILAHEALWTRVGWPATFLSICTLAGAAVFLLYPETSRRSLEWTERCYAPKISIFVFRNKAMTSTTPDSRYEDLWPSEDEELESVTRAETKVDQNDLTKFSPEQLQAELAKRGLAAEPVPIELQAQRSQRELQNQPVRTERRELHDDSFRRELLVDEDPTEMP